jgi:hypothetical protein
VQFDSVAGAAALAVPLVEEADAGDRRRAGQVRIDMLGWWSFPHPFSSAAFARAILRRFETLAFLAIQPASGNSTTIV